MVRCSNFHLYPKGGKAGNCWVGAQSWSYISDLYSWHQESCDAASPVYSHDGHWLPCSPASHSGLCQSIFAPAFMAFWILGKFPCDLKPRNNGPKFRCSRWIYHCDSGSAITLAAFVGVPKKRFEDLLLPVKHMFSTKTYKKTSNIT